PPELCSREVVTDQPARPEVADHALSIRHGRGRGGAAFGGVKPLQFLRPRVAFPEQLALAPLIAMRLKLAVIEGRQKDPVAPDAGRRKAGWHRNLPKLVRAGTELHRRLGRLGYTGRVRSAKLRPPFVAGRRYDRCKQHRCENVNG